MNTENRSSLARSRNARWDLLLDGLSCWLLSIGVILAFDQLFRFHASPAAIVLHPLLIIGILLLFYRRTWLIPILLLAGLCLTAAILSVSGALTPALEYLGSLFRWWMDLFPRRSPLNTAGNILLVQWLIHIGITCTLYLCVRLTHSAVFIASAGCLLFLIIGLNGFHNNIPAMAWMTAGLLPLLARNFQPRRPSPFSPTVLTALRPTRLAAAAVCAALSVLAALLLPSDTSAWKWRPMANMAADFASMLNLQGDNDMYRPITLKSIGLQPNADHLGGDIRLDNYSPVMQVDTPIPTLMKGRVYEEYTGSGWTNAEDDIYRFDSERFSDQYRRAFDIGKPFSDAGAALWQSLMTPVSAQVTLLNRSSSLYGYGRMQTLTMLDAKNQPPMFNPRSELFVQTLLPSKTRYSFTTEWLNRQEEGFMESMTALERAAGDTMDADYSSIQYQYTRLPSHLSGGVEELARQVTASAPTPYAKMAALESYLRGNYTYTLTPGDVPRGTDFVEYFLQTKQGYCVYFASAMAVMARTQGIPARFVVGYGLESNGNGTWIALQKNAHAWVECYFYGIGWVAFDPTASSGYNQPRPPQSAGTPDDPEPFDPMPGGTTTTKEPTTTTRPDIPTTTAPPVASTTTVHQEPGKPVSLPPWAWLLLPCLALLAALGWLLWRLQRFRMMYRPDYVQRKFPDPAGQAAYYYTDLLRQLAALGYTPHTGETLLQFSSRILEGGNVEPELTPVFTRLMDWRYGEVPLTAGHVAEIAAAHEQLEDCLRGHMNGWRYFWKRMIGHR